MGHSLLLNYKWSNQQIKCSGQSEETTLCCTTCSHTEYIIECNLILKAFFQLQHSSKGCHIMACHFTIPKYHFTLLQIFLLLLLPSINSASGKLKFLSQNHKSVDSVNAFRCKYIFIHFHYQYKAYKLCRIYITHLVTLTYYLTWYYLFYN